MAGIPMNDQLAVMVYQRLARGDPKDYHVLA